MLSYAYLDEEEVEKVKPPSLEKKIMETPKMPASQEETECNLVVMFFVVGVIILAIMDSSKN
jgi:hypothetical protein